MQIATIAGNLGKDAVFKTAQDGTPLCSFSVGVSTGWGDRKQTTWWDVTRWGKGADKLAEMLPKGTKVTVSGEVSTREYDGKTYLQIRADHVTLQGGRGDQRGERRRSYDDDRPGEFGEHRREPGRGGSGAPQFDEALDDEVPFAWAETGFRVRRVF